MCSYGWSSRYIKPVVENRVCIFGNKESGRHIYFMYIDYPWKKIQETGL